MIHPVLPPGTGDTVYADFSYSLGNGKTVVLTQLTNLMTLVELQDAYDFYVTSMFDV